MRRSNLEFHFCADRDGLRQQARLGVGRGARSKELIGWPQYVAHPEHVIAQAERKKIRDRVIIQFNRAARNVGEHGPRVASGIRRRCENPAAACRCARRDDGRRRRSGRRARGDGERYPASLSIAVGVVELVTVEVVLPLTNRDSKLAPTATFASPEIDQRSSSRKSPPAPNCGPMKLLCVPMTSLVPVMVLVELVKLGFPGSPRAFANVVTSV
jgi:hypothetical protein